MQTKQQTSQGVLNPLDDSALHDAIVHTVAYVDVFDYPLTADEIYRYLKMAPASREQVIAALQHPELVGVRLSSKGEYYTLPGRENIVTTRRARAEVAAHLWPGAIRFGRRIAGMPFVQMVAVTGSLAVDNADWDADIDYFIISRPGRIWLCRAFVILIVRLAARQGIQLCPNYFLAADTLTFSEQNLYAAHELAQMALIAGHETYERLRQCNGWASRFLPNASGLPRTIESRPISRPQRWFRGISETLLNRQLGDRLEKWEMNRKIARFGHMLGDNTDTEAAFCADWCKGHFESHGQRTMAAFNHRLNTLGED